MRKRTIFCVSLIFALFSTLDDCLEAHAAGPTYFWQDSQGQPRATPSTPSPKAKTARSAGASQKSGKAGTATASAKKPVSTASHTSSPGATQEKPSAAPPEGAANSGQPGSAPATPAIPLTLTVTPSVVYAGQKYTLIIEATGQSCTSKTDLASSTGAVTASSTDDLTTDSPQTISGKPCQLGVPLSVSQNAVEGTENLLLQSKSTGKPEILATISLKIQPQRPKAPGPIPPGLGAQTDLAWKVLPRKAVADRYGNRVADHFFAIEATIGNNTGYDLQIAALSFKLPPLKTCEVENKTPKPGSCTTYPATPVAPLTLSVTPSVVYAGEYDTLIFEAMGPSCNSLTDLPGTAGSVTPATTGNLTADRPQVISGKPCQLGLPVHISQNADAGTENLLLLSKSVDNPQILATVSLKIESQRPQKTKPAPQDSCASNDTKSQTQPAQPTSSPATDDSAYTPSPTDAYPIVRGTVEREQSVGTRAIVVNLVRAAGPILTGVGAFYVGGTSQNYLLSANIFSGPFEKGLELVYPDLTTNHLINLDNNSLRDNTVISNNQQVRVNAFISRELIECGYSSHFYTFQYVPKYKPCGYVQYSDGKQRTDGRLPFEHEYDPELVKANLGQLVLVGRQIDYLSRVRIVSGTQANQEAQAGPVVPPQTMNIDIGSSPQETITGLHLTGSVVVADSPLSISSQKVSADGNSITLTLDASKAKAADAGHYTLKVLNDNGTALVDVQLTASSTTSSKDSSNQRNTKGKTPAASPKP